MPIFSQNFSRSPIGSLNFTTIPTDAPPLQPLPTQGIMANCKKLAIIPNLAGLYTLRNFLFNEMRAIIVI